MELIHGQRYRHADRNCHRRADGNTFRDLYTAGVFTHRDADRHGNTHIHPHHHVRDPAQQHTHGNFHGDIDPNPQPNGYRYPDSHPYGHYRTRSDGHCFADPLFIAYCHNTCARALIRE